MRKRYLRGRTGFTLVELMVAAALTILIMTVISMAFQTGLTTLSHLKSMGDLAERLRVAQDRLRDDLECEHFFRGNSVGQRKLSDVRYDKDFDGKEVPTIGYFRIEQNSASVFDNFAVAVDSTGMISTRRADPQDAIEFTVWRKTSQPDKMMSAALPAAESLFVQEQSATDKSLGSENYVAEWARVRWQLKSQGTINSVPVFSLHRSVRLLANGNQQNGNPYASSNPAVTGLIMSVDGFNNIQRADLATRSLDPTNNNRIAMLPYDATSGKQGDDLVLTNVVSFEVKPSWTRYPAATIAPHNQDPRTMLAPGIPNSDYPFDDLPAMTNPTGKRVFDTYTHTFPGAPPTTDIAFKARITGLQIKIRVYEPKNNMTRQSTIVVKL